MVWVYFCSNFFIGNYIKCVYVCAYVTEIYVYVCMYVYMCNWNFQKNVSISYETDAFKIKVYKNDTFTSFKLNKYSSSSTAF